MSDRSNSAWWNGRARVAGAALVTLAGALAIVTSGQSAGPTVADNSIAATDAASTRFEPQALAETAVQTQQARPSSPRMAPPRGVVDFIVKVRGDGELDACLEAYREDPRRGRELFRRWASDKPQLDGARLSGSTYSGEAIISYDTPADAPRRFTEEIHDRLMSINGVAYADRDYTASTQEDPVQ